MLNDGKYQKGVNRILSILEMSTNYEIVIFHQNIDKFIEILYWTIVQGFKSQDTVDQATFTSFPVLPGY